jgi:tRNA (guanine-N7-)-methyltransferase
MSKVFKDYPEITLIDAEVEGKLNFEDIFGRKAPVHIEVGSGKATFLVNEAKSRPDINLLGIEWCSKVYRQSVDRIGRWGLTNVRIIRADAAEFIREHVADGAVECFHIYFPDPWPKKKHHKRRFIKELNVKELVRCLGDGGMIKVATDHAGYFEQVQQVLGGPEFMKVDFFRTAGAQAEAGEWAGTNFERKYLKEGRAIYTMAVVKK